jgi:hypothetical protein
VATQEKIKCKVTDTKQEILKVYKSHLEEINARAQGSLDTEKVTAEKAKVETLKRVEQVAKLDVPTTIAQLQTNINQTLSGILSTLDEKRTALAAVEEAIKIKQAELSELYGIEKEAASLAALIESYRNKEDELTTEHDERMSEINAAVEEARKTMEKQKVTWQQELVDLKRNDTVLRQRELDQYTYTFNRDKQAKLDALNDEIAKKNLVVAQREDAVALREKNVGELEKKVVELDARIVSETERVRKETEASEKRSAQTAAQFAAMGHKAEVERLTSQLEAANARVKDLLDSNVRLQASLDKANSQVQGIAVEALKSGADAKTIAELRSFETPRGSK